jgi:hypothetical protein
MPQASDELRAEMDRRFGDSIDSQGPIKFLRERGWTLNRDWTWSKPGMTLGNMPRDEFECVLFLIHEWDFGGVTEPITSSPTA